MPERVAAVGLMGAVGGCCVEEPELIAFLRLVQTAARDPEAAKAEAARQSQQLQPHNVSGL